MNGQQYLINICIGPVKDFINSARRSRDLWFGSYLLAELSKCVAKTIAEREGMDALIFPAPTSRDHLKPRQREGFNVVNVILATSCHPQDLSLRCKAAARKFLTDYANSVFQPRFTDQNGNSQTKTFDRTKAIAQIKDLLEFYCVSVPLDENNYIQTRERLSRLMIARKACRNFAPVGGWGDTVPKSSLDGLRESVIHHEITAYKNRPAQLYLDYGVRPGEQLCGIGLLKRHGERYQGTREEGFMSSSHIAALPLLERMAKVYQNQDTDQRRTSRKALDDYLAQCGDGVKCNRLLPSGTKVTGGLIKGRLPGTDHPVFYEPNKKDAKKHNLDGRLLYANRLVDFFDPKTEQAKIRSAQELLTIFLKSAAQAQQPNPYYVLLRADGDHMSDALSQINTIPEHQQFSRDLAAFAADARNIVSQADGGLIYAGGEDVLAFLPLHKALACARRLSYSLANRLSHYNCQRGSPTLSAGLVISHHLDPLEDALGHAQQAEITAKEHYSRNALAITLVKRGGSAITAGGQWDCLYQRLQYLIQRHRQDDLPDGVGYELIQLEKTVHPPAIAAESARILGRKRAQCGSQPVSEATRQRLQDWVRQTSPTQLAHELLIAKEIANAQDLASPGDA